MRRSWFILQCVGIPPASFLPHLSFRRPSKVGFGQLLPTYWTTPRSVEDDVNSEYDWLLPSVIRVRFAFGPSWTEAMSYRSPPSITGRDQNGLLLDLGIVPIFAEILNVLNKGQWGRFFRLPWVLDAPTHH